MQQGGNWNTWRKPERGKNIQTLHTGGVSYKTQPAGTQQQHYPLSHHETFGNEQHCHLTPEGEGVRIPTQALRMEVTHSAGALDFQGKAEVAPSPILDKR